MEDTAGDGAIEPYPAPDSEAEAIRRGYEQFAPPQVPAGMYYDRPTGLVLPQGVRPASVGRVAGAYCLAVALFIGTLGVGYLIWALVTWGHGQTPAQRLLGLRCWEPSADRGAGGVAGQVAGRGKMAIRQVTGILLNGELLMGPFIMLLSPTLNSVGDFFAGTVVLHDPDGLLVPAPREP
ncbi:MAG TPA: hypothetical protein VME19_06445 [Streptosporangiaceae bacterium]|nr:hypothetical protein [Streptosporangiaceae bacterium]